MLGMAQGGPIARAERDERQRHDAKTPAAQSNAGHRGTYDYVARDRALLQQLGSAGLACRADAGLHPMAAARAGAIVSAAAAEADQLRCRSSLHCGTSRCSRLSSCAPAIFLP